MTIEQIIDAIKEMKVLELNELVKKAEEEFGVSAAAPVAVGVAAGPAEAAEEKSEFDVILADAGASKVGVKDAKDLVDGATKPLKEGVSKEEAEEIKAKLEGAGAKVEVK